MTWDETREFARSLTRTWSLRGKGHIGFIPACLQQMWYLRLMHYGDTTIYFEIPFQGLLSDTGNPTMCFRSQPSHLGVDPYCSPQERKSECQYGSINQSINSVKLRHRTGFGTFSDSPKYYRSQKNQGISGEKPTLAVLQCSRQATLLLYSVQVKMDS